MCGGSNGSNGLNGTSLREAAEKSGRLQPGQSGFAKLGVIYGGMAGRGKAGSDRGMLEAEAPPAAAAPLPERDAALPVSGAVGDDPARRPSARLSSPMRVMLLQRRGGVSNATRSLLG